MRTNGDTLGWMVLGLLPFALAACATGASPFNSDRSSEPSEVRFRTFDVAEAHGCGITVDGRVTCWGDGSAVGASPTSTVWRTVAVADGFACGVNESGSLRCWGSSPALAGALSSGKPRFEQLAVGQDVCGLTTEGVVICQSIASGKVSRWEGRFSQVSSGAVATCGLTRNGSVICMRGNGRSKRFFVDRDDVNAVETFGNSVCILGAGQALRCRSLQTGERIPTPTGRYVAVDGRGRNRCALGTKGEAVCWPIGSGRGTRISGPFEQIQAADGFVCGRIEGGYIICRGGDGSGGDAPRTVSGQAVEGSQSDQAKGESP